MNIGIIFAGGIGQRMKSKALPKQFLLMHGKPIIAHTLEVFESCDEIDGIVVACVPEWIDYLKDIIRKYDLKKVKSVAPGGETSQISTFNALKEAEKFSQGEKSIVLIHDGVRPLITHETIRDNIASVKAFGSAITCVPAKETVLHVGTDGDILNVPSRASCRMARAPQSFYLDEIIAVGEQAQKDGIFDFIDSCSMMQHYGKKLHLVEGPEMNIKVTTPQDFYIMRAILDEKENAQIYGVEPNE